MDIRMPLLDGLAATRRILRNAEINASERRSGWWFSPRTTVKTHLAHILGKLGLRDRELGGVGASFDLLALQRAGMGEPDEQ